MTSKKEWTVEEKMNVVLEMLKAERPTTQICKEYGVNDNVVYRWREEALAGMKDGLKDKRKNKNISFEAEKDKLLKIIGQQQVVIDFQKKISQAI